MNRTRWVLPILAAIVAAGVGGYWLDRAERNP
jgi:hypothetical protein